MTLNRKVLFAALGTLTASAFFAMPAHAKTVSGAAFAKHADIIEADTVVRTEKLHPSANRSYKVAGKRYTPMKKVSSFSQTGRASWYGNKFHGRKTASGERYNMHALTAAHRTLPIPSYARVTNTRNGKSVIVRINDRGPFHGSRVIDVSRAAAQKLGFINQGTAHVKIEQIVPGSRSAQNEVAENIYVDLKTFGTRSEAQAYLEQTAQRLNAAQTEAKISLEPRNREFVVRMGPFKAQAHADAAAQQTRIEHIAQTAI